MASVLCVWMTLVFVSFNWQSPSLMAFCAWTKEIAAAAFALLLFTAPRAFRVSWPLVICFLVMLAFGCLWGLNDTFYWDGIQTAGRSQLLVDGQGAGLTRFSLTYVVLGYAFRVLGHHNWVGHAYVMACGILILYLLSRQFRLPQLKYLAVLFAFLSPHLFTVSKWLFMDIPVVAGILATVLIYNWAAARPTFTRFALAFIVLFVTSLLKEVGGIVVIPLLFLPLLVRSPRRLRVAAGVFLTCLPCLLVTYLVCNYYSTHKAANYQHLEFIGSHPESSSLVAIISWVRFAVWHHLQVLALWGYLLFALLGLVKPRSKRGYVFLLLPLLLLQCGMLLNLHGLKIFRGFHGYPLSDATRIGKYLIAALVVLAIGLLRRDLAWRRPSRIEILSWIMLISTVAFFSLTGRLAGPREKPWGGINWRYITPAAPFLALLAAQGVARLLALRNPGPFRMAVCACLATTLLFQTLKSAEMAAYHCQKARLCGEAFQTVANRPEKIVFTHWPFFMNARVNLDYGDMRWRSDGIGIRALSDLAKPAVRASLAPGVALMIHDSDAYSLSAIVKRYGEVLLHRENTMIYLRSFRLKVQHSHANSMTVAKVRT